MRKTFLPLLALMTMMASAQDAPFPTGHWEGVLKAPQNEVPIMLDLYQGADKNWTGHFGFVDPNQPKEITISKVAVSPNSVAFDLELGRSVPFKGTLDPAAKTITGTLAGPDGSEVKVDMKLTGPPKPLSPSTSTKIDSAIEGNWAGTIQIGANTLRLTLDLATGMDGKGTGVLTSIDQGNAKLPVSNVRQEGQKLAFDVKQVGGTYSATINEAKTAMEGTWTQAGSNFPLKLEKGGAAKADPKATPEKK